jgi:glycine betaine/proline transport system ATP-binding protein
VARKSKYKPGVLLLIKITMNNKIEIKNLSIIFGHDKSKARKLIMEGKNKSEILKSTGCTVAVRNANLEIREGEVFVVMGLSGSGKSTLLRCINRLNEPTLGEVYINGENITRKSDKELQQLRRSELAMVFQHFGLLPHRTVLSNIAFGLELQGVPKVEREKKALRTVGLVGLKGYENQRVNELSGGMQQRVGLARALANDASVLLMDEAFSALDPLIREQMQDELLQLQASMQKTIVFITHDLHEAIKLGDRIAIMKDGEVVQVGTPEEILTEPANDYVERFVENVGRGRIITASSIMKTKPVVARLKKEGPEAIIRKMREKNLFVLPVVGTDGQFLGEVSLKDVVNLRKQGIKEIDSVVTSEVPSVLESTTVEDMLTLLPKIKQVIPVVSDSNKLLGVVSPSSIIIEMTGKDQKEINQIIQNAIDL